MTENEAVAVDRATEEIENMLRLGDRPTRFVRPVIAPVIEQPPEPEPVPTPIKIDHTMLPIDALEEVSRALMYGQRRHGAWGWIENPKSYNELLAKAQRHIFEFQRGVTIDPTTQLSHIACAICDLMFLQSNHLKGRGTDDRFKG
jgi:hypothetical protein